jgi:hypothetical protein
MRVPSGTRERVAAEQLRHRQDPCRPGPSDWLPASAAHRVRFTTAVLVHELMEARDENKLLRYQKQIAAYYC